MDAELRVRERSSPRRAPCGVRTVYSTLAAPRIAREASAEPTELELVKRAAFLPSELAKGLVSRPSGLR